MQQVLEGCKNLKSGLEVKRKAVDTPEIAVCLKSKQRGLSRPLQRAETRREGKIN